MANACIAHTIESYITDACSRLNASRVEGTTAKDIMKLALEYAKAIRGELWVVGKTPRGLAMGCIYWSAYSLGGSITQEYLAEVFRCKRHLCAVGARSIGKHVLHKRISQGNVIVPIRYVDKTMIHDS